MNKTLTDLMKISHKPGNDPALVQGGGGNTSVKTPDGKGALQVNAEQICPQNHLLALDHFQQDSV